MIFQIDFNRVSNDQLLLEIGATKQETDEFIWYEIELNNFEDLAPILKKLKELTGEYYSAIISDDPWTIYLDKDV